MIDKTELERVINEALEGTGMFLVTLKVSKDNIIDVALDSDEDITIDDCVAVNDAVAFAYLRDKTSAVASDEVVVAWFYPEFSIFADCAPELVRAEEAQAAVVRGALRDWRCLGRCAARRGWHIG